MTAIRIVCTHDALPLAEKTLARVLSAEGYDVAVCYGRNSLNELPAAQNAREAVVLIWSHDAPGAHYMLEWANGIDPNRLIELARAPGWPRMDRRAPVIDFAQWRGERGGRAWGALEERLRQIARALSPVKPPPRHSMLAVGLASAAMVAGAVAMRINDSGQADTPQTESSDSNEVFAAYDPEEGVGGTLDLIEPASIEELRFTTGPFGGRLAQLPARAATTLAPLPAVDLVTLRDPTLLERIVAFNPLPVRDRTDSN